MVASTAPADAHDYTKEGTVSAKEANKLFKQAFKQRCLTVHEARHIVHGSGLRSWTRTATCPGLHGTRKSHIYRSNITIDATPAASPRSLASATKRRDPARPPSRRGARPTPAGLGGSSVARRLAGCLPIPLLGVYPASGTVSRTAGHVGPRLVPAAPTMQRLAGNATVDAGDRS